jgi:pyridoxal phosphate enzyme (YggS family)
MSKQRKDVIARNLEQVNEKILNAADRSGRSAVSIRVVVVTKTWSPDVIRMAAELGVRDFGENRIQEALTKIDLVNRDFSELKWHMIGHLQSNKARRAVEKFDVIQSVDRLKIARKISAVLVEMQRQMDILLEINISGEAAKFGISPDHVVDVAAAVRNLPNLNLRGLMTVGPLTADTGKIRSAFQKMRKFYDFLKTEFSDKKIDILSMGMSDDYEIAIDEGSTMVRLGRAIFGNREP